MSVTQSIRIPGLSVYAVAVAILAIFNVPDLPLMGIASRLTHSFEYLRDPLVLFSPTHERAPPISLLS